MTNSPRNKTNIPDKRFLLLVAFLLTTMIAVTSCTDDFTGVPHGRIIVWHSWNANDTAVLNDLIVNFQTLNPETNVTVLRVAPEQLEQEYLNATPLGFGPDLLIAPSEILPNLFQNDTLHPFTNELDESLRQIFPPASVELGRLQDEIYAIPLSLRPMGLFYNRDLVENLPPNQTFDGLVVEAGNGRTLGINSNPEPAYMGIGAFGEGMFTADGALAASQPGLTNWLTWLNNNTGSPGVLITPDSVVLRDRFTSGQLAYYPAFYDEWHAFSQALDSEDGVVVGVAPLPQGPFGLARPLLRAEMMSFNPTSSDRQFETAFLLAVFLANQEQNRRLMREARRVPANQLVRIDATVYPEIAAFAAQGRTAVSIPVGFDNYVLGPPASALYTSVLSGVQSPEQAVCEYQATITARILGQTPDVSICQPNSGLFPTAIASK